MGLREETTGEEAAAKYIVVVKDDEKLRRTLDLLETSKLTLVK